MSRVADGRYELKIGLSILTRRGGTDANALERPRNTILRDWHVRILAPQFLENPGKLNSKHMNVYFYGTRIGRNEQWMRRSG